MKKVISNVFLAATLLIGTSVMFTSCSKPCKDVVCENGGTEREDGDDCVCDCVTGYEGDLCETEMRTKFLQTNSTVAETCGSSQTPAYNASISASNDAVEKILIKNLGNYNCSTGDYFVVGTVNGNNINISSQQVCATTFSGSGKFVSTGVVEITYAATYNPGTGNVTDNCTATYTIQ